MLCVSLEYSTPNTYPSFSSTYLPRLRFSAHHHVKFAAVVRHPAATPAAPTAVGTAAAPPAAAPSPAVPGSLALPPGLGIEMPAGGAAAAVAAAAGAVTKFLALDKCLPRRDFLQVRPRCGC